MKNRIRRAVGSLSALLLLLSASILPAAEDKVAFLTEKLQEKSSFKVRLKAAIMLGRMGDSRAINPLCSALEDDNYVVRGAAARALGNLGHPMAVRAVDPLLSLVRDDESFVRREARRALERIAGEKSLEQLTSALNNESSAVRHTVVQVLARMNLPNARSAIVSALGDSDDEVREEAIVAVKGMGLAEMESLLLMALSKRENYQVQATAARLTGELKITAAAGVLADLLVRDDVVPEVKREAQEALSGMKQEMNVHSLVKQLVSQEHLQRDQAIQLLGIHGGRDAVDALMGLLKHDDAYVRRRAVFALGDTGDPRAVPALQFLLKTEENPRFLETIKSTIRKLQPH